MTLTTDGLPAMQDATPRRDVALGRAAALGIAPDASHDSERLISPPDASEQCIRSRIATLKCEREKAVSLLAWGIVLALTLMASVWLHFQP